MKLKFYDKTDSALIRTSDWMLGYGSNAPHNWRFNNWSNSRRRLASPLSHYLGEIERFSLDRGVSIDLEGVPQDDPKQQLLTIIQERNFTEELNYRALERGAVTGSVFWGFIPDPEKYYRVYLYDACEVQKYPKDSGIKGFMVQTKGERNYKRFGFTETAYIEYNSSTNPHSEWSEAKVTPHPYGFPPMVQVVNKVADHSFTGEPSFDWMALEMAIEICAQTLSSAANYSYFGGPFLVSSDPKETLQELMSRKQVLTGRMSSDIQDTELLSMPAMPTNHKEFVDNLARSFADHMRISWVPDTPPGDTSSLTLRLLFSKTINSAQKVGSRYLGGFRQLLEKLLLASAIDGYVVGVSAVDPESYQLSERFRSDIFPMTPQEKQQTLAVVEQLQLLGVSPEKALQEYYTDLNSDEIQELLIGA